MKIFESAYNFNDKKNLAWLTLRLLIAGVVFLLAGAVCFVAENWSSMGAALKLSLPLFLLVVCGAGVWRASAQTLVGQACAFGAAVAIGLFWAVFGQLYPCGAFLYELFGWWVLLLVPLCVLARNKWLWLFAFYVALCYLFSKDSGGNFSAYNQVVELSLIAWAAAVYKKTSPVFQRFIWVPLTLYACEQGISARIFTQVSDVYLWIAFILFALEGFWAHVKKDSVLFGTVAFCTAALLSAVTFRHAHDNFLAWFVYAAYFAAAGAATFFFYHAHSYRTPKTTVLKPAEKMPFSVRALLFLCAFVAAVFCGGMLWLMKVPLWLEGILLGATGWLFLYKVRAKKPLMQSFLHYVGLVLAVAGQCTLTVWAVDFFRYKDEWVILSAAFIFYVLFPHTLNRLAWCAAGAFAGYILMKEHINSVWLNALFILAAFMGALALIRRRQQHTYPLAYGLLLFCAFLLGIDRDLPYISEYLPLVMGLILMYMGHVWKDKYAEFFGLVGAVYAVGYIYYSLQMPLSYKALILGLSGGLCLVLWRKYAR